MNASLFDAHNHLQDERLAANHTQIIAECRSVGVAGMVVNGTCQADWPKVLKLARQHDFILPSFGYHPWYLDQRTPDWIDELHRHLDAIPSAIGEIGIDRWMENHDPELQAEMFTTQLGIAAERNLPLSIHCLKAWGALINLLESNPIPECGFLIHSYGGSAEMIPRFARLGAYFSISGYFAHDRKAKQQEVFKQIPSERLLIESDAPDMAPPELMIKFPYSDPATNKPANHPANLRSIYEFVASLLGESSEQLATRIAVNHKRFFLLGE